MEALQNIMEKLTKLEESRSGLAESDYLKARDELLQSYTLLCDIEMADIDRKMKALTAKNEPVDYQRVNEELEWAEWARRTHDQPVFDSRSNLAPAQNKYSDKPVAKPEEHVRNIIRKKHP